MVKGLVLLATLGAALPHVLGTIRCNGGDEDPPFYCGDGVVDEGEACDDGAGNSDVLPDACRTDCRMASCGDGVVDPQHGEACDDPDFPGCEECRFVEYCGDGEVQFQRGEACDDGNMEDGDGCSAYCRSETCGNGQVEEAFEECDDGNFQSHDGCSSGCTREYLWWDDQVAMSEGRFGHAATWDASRQHLVIFGGSDGTILRDDVLETRWAGSGWSIRSPTPRPAARERAALTHFPIRGGSLLLGGLDQGGSVLGGEWLWDGTTWWSLTTPVLPTPRYGATMVFDEGLSRMVLFGGHSGGGDATLLGDTWERDEDTWWEASGGGGPGSDPSPRMRAAATYDASACSLLLFGGYDGRWLDDTWVRNGSGWAELALAVAPPLLEEVALFHHRNTGASYLVGTSAEGMLGLYRFLGDRWEEVQRVYGYHTSPYAMRSFAGAINTDHGEIWLTGGHDQTDYLFRAALRLVHRSSWPDEKYCNQTLDRDHDGLAGCEDPDCQESQDCP